MLDNRVVTREFCIDRVYPSVEVGWREHQCLEQPSFEIVMCPHLGSGKIRKRGGIELEIAKRTRCVFSRHLSILSRILSSISSLYPTC